MVRSVSIFIGILAIVMAPFGAAATSLLATVKPISVLTATTTQVKLVPPASACFITIYNTTTTPLCVGDSDAANVCLVGIKICADTTECVGKAVSWWSIAPMAYRTSAGTIAAPSLVTDEGAMLEYGKSCR
jgi:hypothetical protein